MVVTNTLMKGPCMHADVILVHPHAIHAVLEYNARTVSSQRKCCSAFTRASQQRAKISSRLLFVFSA